jgi:hypothetical protein
MKLLEELCSYKNFMKGDIIVMTEELKKALANLLATIIDFVKRIFAAEVGGFEDLIK